MLVFVSLYISRLLCSSICHLLVHPVLLRCLFIRSSLPLASLIPLFFCLPVNQRSFLCASTSYRYNMLQRTLFLIFLTTYLYLPWHFTSANIRSPLACILKSIHLLFEFAFALGKFPTLRTILTKYFSYLQPSFLLRPYI